MNHTEAKERFSDYAEDALARKEKRAVRAHLEECAACQTEYEAFTRALAQLGQLKSHPPEPSPDFVANVQGQIRRRSRGRFFARKTPRFPLELVSLLTLLIMLVVYLFFVVAQPSKVHEGAPQGMPSGGH